MTVITIGKQSSEADKLAEQIKQLRDLFPLDYRPQFQVGDIVRFRPAVAKLVHHKGAADWFLIVVAVKREGEDWRYFENLDPCDDVQCRFITFETDTQQEEYRDWMCPASDLELVERAPARTAPKKLDWDEIERDGRTVVRVQLQPGALFTAQELAGHLNRAATILDQDDTSIWVTIEPAPPPTVPQEGP